MDQSRKHSIIEVCTSTSIGFVGSWGIAELTLMYHFGFVGVALQMTVWCTVWSIMRGYTLRRLFARQRRYARKGY